jgi:hypothetical protein
MSIALIPLFFFVAIQLSPFLRHDGLAALNGLGVSPKKTGELPIYKIKTLGGIPVKDNSPIYY